MGRGSRFADEGDGDAAAVRCSSARILRRTGNIARPITTIACVEKGIYTMATYLMFGKYSLDALNAISAERTESAEKVIKENGGTLTSGYALLGDANLVLIVELADTERAMQTSAALTKLLGISFSTVPAVSLEDFDRIMS